MFGEAADATAGRLASLPSATKRSLSDQALIARIAGRDKRAMQALYARHHVHLYRFVRALVHEETRAEDIVCDVFLDVWRHANLIQKQREVSTWLLASAHEKAMRWLPRNTSGKPGAIGDRVANEDPGTILDRSETLHARLTALPPHCREIIDLVYYHGISINDAAQILRVPAITVKARMVNARKQLAIPELATCDTGH
jgi:RNA polymerase sigma-70 factor, ECF subfamily